jgi:DNA-binding CsgD family transcriptional regulator
MQSNSPTKTGKIISLALVGAGVILLGLSLIPGMGMKITLPLVFLMAGVSFILLVFYLTPKIPWAAVLFIPGSLLASLGVVFLFNSITGDWKAWAYAWMLVLAGSGMGTIFAARWLGWAREVTLVGQGLVVFGSTFFIIFGAIAGGLFIEVMAPILLALGGLALYRIGPEKILSGRFFHPAQLSGSSPGTPSPDPTRPALVEPLSGRELEVLRLIDRGLSNPEIAAHLTVAQSTIKTHINNIYGKLEVQTRVQAINRGRQLGLLDDNSPR